MKPNDAKRREQARSLLSDCFDDFDLFNSAVLGRGAYWSKQREICESIARYPTTLIQSCNLSGKTFVLSGAVLAYQNTRRDALTISTAPSQSQLEDVLWKEIRAAHKGSRIPLPGRFLSQPQKLIVADKHFALGYSTTKVERLSGHHQKYVLAVVDEASGVDPKVMEAIDSLDADRKILAGNPLYPSGPFYDKCRAAKPPLSNLIQISAFDTPDIHLDRSPRGLASRIWLESVRNDYGEGSLYWTVHVLGLFPDSAVDAVIPRAWLDLAGRTIGRASGPTRIAIDLGEGKGGNRTVIGCADDNVLREIKHSRVWSFETAATEAALMAQRHQVEPHRVSWDVAGIGADFENRLKAVGLIGCRPYRGGNEGGRKFGNLRSAAAWAARQRLDPNRMITLDGGVMVPQQPFAIRPAELALIREELQGLVYELDQKGRVCLENKLIYAARLKRSPDFADMFCQLFAFPSM